MGQAQNDSKSLDTVIIVETYKSTFKDNTIQSTYAAARYFKVQFTTITSFFVVVVDFYYVTSSMHECY